MKPAEPQSTALSNAMLEMAGNLVQLIETAAGHRRTAVAAGFSDEVAERMAEDLHGHLLAAAFKASH